MKKLIVGRIRQTKIINLKLTIQAHNALKCHCSKKGMTMQDYLFNLVMVDMTKEGYKFE